MTTADSRAAWLPLSTIADCTVALPSPPVLTVDHAEKSPLSKPSWKSWPAEEPAPGLLAISGRSSASRIRTRRVTARCRLAAVFAISIPPRQDRLPDGVDSPGCRTRAYNAVCEPGRVGIGFLEELDLRLGREQAVPWAGGRLVSTLQASVRPSLWKGGHPVASARLRTTWQRALLQRYSNAPMSGRATPSPSPSTGMVWLSKSRC